MDFSRSLILIVTLTCSSASFSQIVTKGEPKVVQEPVKDSVKPKRIPTDGTDEFSFYLGAAYVNANRILTVNDNLFAQPLGERANEKALNTWSYQIGLRNQISKWVAYDAAVSFETNGESYTYDDPSTDSTYSYETTYKYVAIPIQFYLSYGKDLRFFLGGGIQPELFTGYKQEITYATAEGKESTLKIDRLDKAQSFLFGLTASAGVQYRIGRIASVYAIPGMLWNLNSTYSDQATSIHKARNFSVKFGFVFHIPN